MTNHSQAADVEGLSRTVASLVEVLDRTEKRSARFTRIVHWSLLGSLFGGLVLLFLIGLGIRSAYASFDKFVFTIEEAITKNEKVGKAVKTYIEKNKHELESEDPYDPEIIRKTVFERLVKVVVDTIIVIEKFGDDPDVTLSKIEDQLSSINRALNTMPDMSYSMKQMSHNMDMMNRNIASMTTSMGSTMGRMGKWMLW